ncbi:hypothetical protein [Streptomyces sp. NPDC000880]
MRVSLTKSPARSALAEVKLSPAAVPQLTAEPLALRFTHGSNPLLSRAMQACDMYFRFPITQALRNIPLITELALRSLEQQSVPELTPPPANFAEAMANPIDRGIFADSLDIALSGGCGHCGTEHDHMCVDCGRCRCYDHETCEHPAS